MYFGEEDRQFLISRSPLFFAERVTKPLMILQGANDPRVKQQESDQFVAALQKNNIPVSYILYPDEGHGFSKANNQLSGFGFIEKFLHSCLGGEYEPFVLGQYNSSAIVGYRTIKFIATCEMAQKRRRSSIKRVDEKMRSIEVKEKLKLKRKAYA
ncbi:hypothetical protein RB195_011652 [Necator americanus]|uniref:Peptidase S9 prolyl oligopeptidase catalytic domain-containing protein n=1 Tax=Necator americanus TaxID=51031 RepID=A0ABR1D3F6_NECAM